MTAEIPDDPFGGLPRSRGLVPLRVARDITGLVLIVAGLGILAAVLATVDTRLAFGLLAVICIAAGLALGRSGEGS